MHNSAFFADSIKLFLLYITSFNFAANLFFKIKKSLYLLKYKLKNSFKLFMYSKILIIPGSHSTN